MRDAEEGEKTWLRGGIGGGDMFCGRWRGRWSETLPRGWADGEEDDMACCCFEHFSSTTSFAVRLAILPLVSYSPGSSPLHCPPVKNCSAFSS